MRSIASFKRATRTSPVRSRKRSGEPSESEDEIQIRLVAELRAAGVVFFHTPNEGRVSKRAAAKRKAMGVTAGVPDFVFVTPPHAVPVYGDENVGGFGARLCIAAALEVKSERGRLTDEQRAMLDYMSSKRWAIAVEYGYAAARARLVAWGYLPP